VIRKGGKGKKGREKGKRGTKMRGRRVNLVYADVEGTGRTSAGKISKIDETGGWWENGRLKLSQVVVIAGKVGEGKGQQR